MNRRAWGVLVLLATAGAVVVGAKQAKSRVKPGAMTAMLETFRGEIVAVDSRDHTFTVRGTETPAREMKFRAEASLEVTVEGQAKSARDLTRGEHVTVTCTGSGDVRTATGVTVEKPKMKG
jgi:hypothetical protein